MEHTFIWQEGSWQASGLFHDKDRRNIKTTGRMDIQHVKDTWIAESSLEMQLEEVLRITNRYKIDPPGGNQTMLSWTALNMALGPVQGTFVSIGDTIFALFHTSEGQRGSETFRKISDNHYHNKGFLMENNRVVSSWEIDWKNR